MTGPILSTAPRIGLWTTALVYGLVSGIALTANEALALPMAALDWHDYMAALIGIYWCWAFVSVGLAWAALQAEDRRWRLRITIPALIVLAALLCAVPELFWWIEALLGIRPGQSLVAGNVFPSWDAYFYMFWFSLCYCPMLVAGSILTWRTERTRRVLAQAELIRSQAEGHLSDAQLEALRARIEPNFLLHALDEIRRRYDHHPASADRLLEELVAFLRGAMPAVRGNASTLDAELQSADAYARIAEQIEPTRPRWTFDLPSHLPETPFPSLMLLPLIDRWTPAERSTSAGEVRLRGDSVAWQLTIRSADRHAALPSSLDYRIRVGLGALLGARCTLTMADGDADDAGALVLSYDARSTSVAAASNPGPADSTPVFIPLNEAAS